MMSTDVLREVLRAEAESLRNGKRGDMDTLCEVVHKMALLLCDIADNGCQHGRKHLQFGWPAAVAWLGTLITVTAAFVAILR